MKDAVGLLNSLSYRFLKCILVKLDLLSDIFNSYSFIELVVDLFD